MSIPPNIGPQDGLQLIATSLFVHTALNCLFSLLTKEKINAFGSTTNPLVDFHAFSVNPPKILPCSDFITVSVFAIPSHLL